MKPISIDAARRCLSGDNNMKIYNIEFSIVETAVIYTRAGANLMHKGMDRKEALKLIKTLTPQNVLRLALDFETRKRGGSRLNAGRPKG